MKKRYKKIILFLSLCFSMLIGLTVSSHAFYYDSDTGNMKSSNLIDVDDLTLFSPNYVFGTYELDSPISSGSYCFSFEFNGSSSASQFYVLDSNLNGVYNVVKTVEQGVNIFSFNLSSTGYYLRIYSNAIGSYSNFMFNSGDYIGFEPYGATFYSQINYENYGSAKYSQGYTDGFNSIYNSLVDVNLSEHVTGIGCGIYNSTGTTFVQNGTITSSYFESNYYHLEVSPIIADNYYVIPISFDNNYVFSSFRWSPNRFSSPSLTINGVSYDSSTVTYNGSTYGWDNLNSNLDSAINSVEFKFKINSNFDGLNLFINGKNLEIATALESYQNGYDNGQTVGYNNGYTDGFTAGSHSVTTDNTSFQKLIWTIGATPFESFKTIWDVDVMGLNISGIILGGLMALLVLYLIKKIWK